jgi:mono/diheme cytochrome c family protein
MMKRILRWTGMGLGSLAGLGLIAYAVFYLLSERALRRTYEIPAVRLSVPTDPASIVEGQRLATLRGCFSGCHGKQAQGEVMIDEPMLARLVAPNLTAAVRKFSDAELAVIIRNGVRPDGRSVLVMPSEAFVELTDADLGRILAFLKSLPAASGPEPDVSLGPLARIGLAVGQFKVAAQLIADTLPPPPAANEEAAYGRYLARTTCPQCHGADLRGTSNPDFTSPDLRVVAAYTPEAFTQLMRTGIAVGGRKPGMMGGWARNNLSQFTDAEIAAVFSYLHAMPEAAHR